MEVTAKEQKRAEQLLQNQRTGLHQIESFSFMKRYHQASHKGTTTSKDKYGPERERRQSCLSASVPPPLFRHPLPGFKGSAFRQLCTAGTYGCRTCYGNLSAPVPLYVLFLRTVPHVSDIRVLFHQR